jgi:hypothetical protein
LYDERNLVVATTFPVFNVQRLRNDLVDLISYRRLTADPPDAAAVTISIERRILHVQLDLPDGTRLHVINVHLKSKIPTDIPGQKIDNYTWRSADASARRLLRVLDETNVAGPWRCAGWSIRSSTPTRTPRSSSRATSTPPRRRSL